MTTEPAAILPPVPRHPRCNWDNPDGTKKGGSKIVANNHLTVDQLPLMDPARMNNGRFKSAAKQHRVAAMLDDEASQAWKALHRARRAAKEPPIQSEAELEQLVRDYFTFLAENPFIHEKPTANGGTFREKVRSVPTIEGIAGYSGVPMATWHRWMNGQAPDHLKDACDVLRATIFDAGLTMAAAGEANAPLMKSYLGITDKTETTTHLEVGDGSVAKAAALEALGITQDELDRQVASIDSARDAVGGAQEVTHQVVMQEHDGEHDAEMQDEDTRDEDATSQQPEEPEPVSPEAPDAEAPGADGAQGGGVPRGVAKRSAGGGLVSPDKFDVTSGNGVAKRGDNAP